MKPVNFAAVGDICLSNNCGKQIELEGPDWPFANVAHVFSQADLLFGNMESVVLPHSYPEDFIDKQGLVSKFDGTEALQRAGFSFMNMASNHILDGGEVGMFHTRDVLETRGIATGGIGRDQEEARGISVLAGGEMRFGFLCYCKDSNYSLGTTGPCHAYYHPDIVLEDISRHRGDVDVLVVSVHADQEHVETPSPVRRKEFHRFAEAGATLVLGHHPHVPQGIELINNRLIAYSLGNFYFYPHTMPWHKNKRPHTAESFVLIASTMPGRVESFRRIPVTIPIPPEMRPTPCVGTEAKRLLNYFSLLDQMCQDESLISKNWRARALHNVESRLHSLYEDQRAATGWQHKLLRLVERSLRVNGRPDLDLDTVFERALIPLLLTPDNREWMEEIRMEAVRRWEALSEMEDIYHRPSYRLSNKDQNAKNAGGKKKSDQ